MRSNVFLREYKTGKGETRFTLIVREYGRKDRSIGLGPVSKRVAQDRRLQVLQELRLGLFKTEPTVHLYVSELVEKYFTDFANGSRSPKTVKTYHEVLKPFLARFRGFRLNQVRRHDVEKYLSEYNVANRTKNLALSTLRLVFQKAVEWGYLSASPAQGIKRLPESSQGSRALSPNELSALWDGLSVWQRSVLRVMVNSGMRPGELSNLKFKDIDWEGDRLGIVTDKTRKTKNRKTRFIPLNQDLREELLFLKENLPVNGGNGRVKVKPREPHQREHVFCHADGGRVASFRSAIRGALKKHGIIGVSPHGLRKTFCSQLARSKVHPKIAQQLMGHSDINLTMRVYTEIDDDQLREAVNALPTMSEMQRSKFQLIVGQK